MTPISSNLLGQITRLSRSIAVQEPLDERAYRVQFLAGNPLFQGLSAGQIVTLWYTASAYQAIKSISSMIRMCYPEFASCDVETIADLVPRVIQDLIFDKEIFDSRLVLSASRKALADCRVDEDIVVFSSKVYRCLVERVRISMCEWCTVLGVPRVICKSFDVPQAGIALLSRMDERKWEEIVASRYETNSWSHFLGCVQGSSIPPIFGAECRSIIVHRIVGTQRDAKFKSAIEFAKFFALLYATVTINEGKSLDLSAAPPYRSCIQFPLANSSGMRIHQSHLDEPVFPFYANEITLSAEAIAAIQKWYADLEALPVERKVKIEKSCYFINRGMVSRGLDSYVSFFVSLDALFGVDRGVGASIQRGIDSLPIARSLKARFSWLYQLRNDLVHGASRYCAEWRKYERYCSSFRAKPEDDIRRLACIAVLCSVQGFDTSL